MSRLAATLAAAVSVLRAADEHDIKYPAAALAYYAFVSFLPLLVLVVAVFGESFTAEILAATPRFLTPEARHLIGESITTASGRAGATILAIVVLAWSAANVAVDFQTVVERVEATPGRPLLAQLRDAVGILGSFVLAVGSMILTGMAFALLPAGQHVASAWPVVLLVVLTVVFLPLYYLPSRVVPHPLAAIPGAFTAAFGWTTLLAFIQFYAENATQYAIYGVLSGIILILTSLYLGAAVLMLGVVVNTMVHDGHSPTRSAREERTR